MRVFTNRVHPTCKQVAVKQMALYAIWLGRHGKVAVGDYISKSEVHSSFSLFYNLRLHVSKTFPSCELDLTQP